MHSTELTSDEFEIRVDGRDARAVELFPGFEERSRIGLVMRDDFGAVGASGLLLAAITAFYDIQRALHPQGFFRYADYFLFHVGRLHGNHEVLDVFPGHKEVVVADDPESILRAINDRAVTHLVVPEGEPGEPRFEPQTVNGAMSRLEGALIYSPRGRVEDADVSILGNERVDHYVWATLRPSDWLVDVEAADADPGEIARVRSRLDEVPDEFGRGLLNDREALKERGRTLETFQRASVEQALRLLSANATAEGVQ